jgi:hypothetical protein
MHPKFQNNNYRGSQQGFNNQHRNNRNNVQKYRGQLNYPPQNMSIPKFQINTFDHVVSLRFNTDFVKQFIVLYNESGSKINSEFVSNFIDDLVEINLLETECFVTEEYHMGKFSNMIYINLHKKYFNDFCSIISSFNSFPPAFFKFKDILSKIYFITNNPMSNREENF